MPTEAPTPDEAATDIPEPDLPTPVAVPTPTTRWTPPPRTKTSGCTSTNGLPDPGCTPGAVDPRVSQTTVGQTVCVRGYTATVRPPREVTDCIKGQQMGAYGLTGQRLAGWCALSRHFVAGDRGVSKWRLTGTTTDGSRIDVHGCDLWEFRGGKISRKDSYWKIVER
jgi:hypothetical protein